MNIDEEFERLRKLVPNLDALRERDFRSMYGRSRSARLNRHHRWLYDEEAKQAMPSGYYLRPVVGELGEPAQQYVAVHWGSSWTSETRETETLARAEAWRHFGSVKGPT